MSFDLPSILVAILAGIVGFYYVKRGRSQADVPLMAAGAGLMVYPYFVESALWSLVIGAAIAAAPFIYDRFGGGGRAPD